MTDWAIGDIQGCADPLFRLLDKAGFNPTNDTLWVAGDLVNRGPDNLSVLRYIKTLGKKAKVVLGNHDLHLIAASYGVRKPSSKDTIQDVINAPDGPALIEWLSCQPLIQYNDQFIMSHAGIAPIWDETQAIELAEEVHRCLSNPQQRHAFIHHLYGNEPDMWSNALEGHERLRVITNYLTRMRFITATGTLDFTAKEDPHSGPAGFTPWFEQPTQARRQILFGHWAGLEGQCPTPRMHALDTGCVWGGELTLLNLTTLQRVSVPAAA